MQDITASIDTAYKIKSDNTSPITMTWFVWIIVAVLALCVINWYVRSLRVSRYDNKHVFITGCDSGFGYLLARRLDELGFRVYAGCLTERGQSAVREQCSSRTLCLPLDVTSDVSIQHAVHTVKQNLQKNEGLWAVVNNAGIIGGIGPTSWHTRQDYENTLAVNLYGVIFVTQAFLPLLVSARGRVVNMASTLGRIAMVAPAYTVSKYGVEAFSDLLRRELLVSGVTVSIIEPGFFNTTLLDEQRFQTAALAKINSLPPHIRQATPDNVINKVLNSMHNTRTKLASNDIFKVVDAYIHAVTARYPKPRYLVGNDVNYIYRVLWNMPEWLADRLIVAWMSR